MAKAVRFSIGINTIPYPYPKSVYFPPKFSTIWEISSGELPEIILTSTSVSLLAAKKLFDMLTLDNIDLGIFFNSPKLFLLLSIFTTS